MIRPPDIPGYQIGDMVGTGGFAAVYRGWQRAVGREVAVKVDNRALLSERDQRRFLREVTAAGRLSGHPHVIDVYDAGTLDDGRPYLVMELCPAGSLNDALRRHGPMDVAHVRGIGAGLADALAAAHAAGVLHRDIKPANILVNRYGMVGLSDFGLASIIAAGGEQTASRDALTPAYAPPESFRGEEPTALGDVYSLAATLYALLAGRPPRFGADPRPPSLATIMMLHDKTVDDVPGTPPELMELLRAALAPDPALRPPSAAALRDALAGRGAAIAAGPGIAAGPAVPAGPAFLGGPTPAPGLRLPAAAVAPPTGPPVSLTGPTGGRPESPVPPSPGSGTGRHAVGGRSSVRRRAAGLAVGLIVIVLAAAVIGARFMGHGVGPGGRTATGGPTGGRTAGEEGVFGIATVSAGCPAASVRVAAARCPAKPECWAGMVVISGAASARSAPCTEPHYWQTFAIAILPNKS